MRDESRNISYMSQAQVFDNDSFQKESTNLFCLAKYMLVKGNFSSPFCYLERRNKRKGVSHHDFRFSLLFCQQTDEGKVLSSDDQLNWRTSPACTDCFTSFPVLPGFSNFNDHTNDWVTSEPFPSLNIVSVSSDSTP